MFSHFGSNFDQKKLKDGDDKELWNQQTDYVNLLFKTHLNTPMIKMIYDDSLVRHQPHKIWVNLITYYKDSSMAYSNASLIGIGLAQLRTSQFDTCMDFLAKFMEELHCYNTYAQARMPPSTCIANLNMETAEDEILNSKVSRIKVDDFCRNGNKTPKPHFLNLYKSVQTAAMKLDSAKILARGTKVKAAQADQQVYHSNWDFDQYIPNILDVQEDCDVSDSVPDQSQLDVYFNSIDIEQCDVATLQAYAAHQKQRQS